MPRFHSADPRRAELIKMAAQQSFKLVFEDPNTYLTRFERDGTIVDVWRSKMTVGIYEDEAKRYLKNVSDEDLVEIFANPNVTL